MTEKQIRDKVRKKCITCGHTFYVRSHRKYTAKYCSYKCRKHYRYQYNDKFFEIIDSPDKAYWLGFIFADGCVKDSKNALQIFLKIKDKSHLENFKKTLNGNFPVRELEKKVFNKTYYQAEVSIWSKKIADDLRVFLKNKNRIPKDIKDGLFCHFLRGLLDGDGCVSIAKKRNRLQVSLLGEKGLLKDIQDRLTEKLKLNYNSTIGWAKGIYYIGYSGKEKVHRFLNFLYKDANIFLDRKYKIYLDYYEKNN